MIDDVDDPTLTNPGRTHQGIKCIALAARTMAEESIDHTDLINDQNELVHQQISHSECVDQLAGSMIMSPPRDSDDVPYLENIKRIFDA